MNITQNLNHADKDKVVTITMSAIKLKSLGIALDHLRDHMFDLEPEDLFPVHELLTSWEGTEISNI